MPPQQSHKSANTIEEVGLEKFDQIKAKQEPPVNQPIKTISGGDSNNKKYVQTIAIENDGRQEYCSKQSIKTDCEPIAMPRNCQVNIQKASTATSVLRPMPAQRQIIPISNEKTDLFQKKISNVESSESAKNQQKFRKVSTEKFEQESSKKLGHIYHANQRNQLIKVARERDCQNLRKESGAKKNLFATKDMDNDHIPSGFDYDDKRNEDIPNDQFDDHDNTSKRPMKEGNEESVSASNPVNSLHSSQSSSEESLSIKCATSSLPENMALETSKCSETARLLRASPLDVSSLGVSTLKSTTSTLSTKPASISKSSSMSSAGSYGFLAAPPSNTTDAQVIII